MKKILITVFAAAIAVNGAYAQTAEQLLGKWKLVKWTHNGNDKKVADSTFQIFNDENKFISVAEGKQHKGKWKLSDDNQKLTIRSGIISVVFKIDYFDNKRRVITADQLGTLEYEKVN